MKVVPSLLIVDDNPGDVELVRVMFGRTGRYPYMFSAPDGQAALDLFEAPERSRRAHPEGCFPPALVLVDINMPRLDGFGFIEAFARLGGESADRPPIVVMLTSSTDPRDRERAAQLGLVSDFITKPPRPETGVDLAEQYGVWRDR